MSAPLCQAPDRELPQLLLGIARMGYRGSIGSAALSSLVAHAKEHGTEAVLDWIRDDPGLLLMPSWQFWAPGFPGCQGLTHLAIVALRRS